jgi:hypothetical protein
VTPAERYILLGLRLGRHVEGVVDAYYGPLKLKQQVADEPLQEPSDLAAEAAALSADLDDGWLLDQAYALETYARVLAGEELSYSDEVEGCYGVRPSMPDEDELRAARAALDELFPGTGSLAERREEWRRTQLVAAEQLLPALETVVAALREKTRAFVDLPDGEGFVLEESSDEPWLAFNYYLGDLQSRVVANVDLPFASPELLSLAAHEVYPGHHTEHVLKEQRLLREQGRLEEAIQLIPTPQAVLSEGIAESGVDIVLDAEGRAQIAEALRGMGIAYDERAEAIRAVWKPFRRLSIGAGLLIHEQGATIEQAIEYMQEWAPFTPDKAAQSVKFVANRTWRAYPITYAAGDDLCRAYVGDEPARFRTLLTEQVRIGELVAPTS